MSQPERHEFQAEIQQLLDIVIHSLYTDKEIFLRELVSNAADACEKLRFVQSSGEAVSSPDAELKISVSLDEEAKTVTIADTGIGMTESELVENLGRIAHSGSKAFLQQLKEGEGDGASLIGQFGVGFYSAFMVADKVTVITKSGRGESEGCRWESDGAGSYTIETAGEAERGTQIVLHLKKEEEGFCDKNRLEGLIKNYSSFVPFPIELVGERVNTVDAIWTKNKSEITEEQYAEFYKYVGHDSQDPLYRLHFNADAPLAIKSLLFVSSKNWETMGMRQDPNVNLHCKKVLIESKSKNLLPEWMRFVRGVVDSEDLPLNISRESMQDSALMQKLNTVITKRFIKFLDEESKKDAEKYDQFFAEFGRFIKEGVASDFANKDSLAKLLRYESSATEAGKTTSLTEYVSRMTEDQKEIYFLVGPNRETLAGSPYYEAFASKKLEVLFLYDPWDEFVMDNLREFDGKTIVAAEKAEIEAEGEKEASESLSEEEAKGLVEWLKETLGDKLNEARVSKRLVDSPAVVVDSDKFMTASMRQMMSAMNKDAPSLKVDLELNDRHPIIVGLNNMRASNEELAKKAAEQLFDNSLAASGLLEDPRTMVKRLNELLEEVLVEKKS